MKLVQTILAATVFLTACAETTPHGDEASSSNPQTCKSHQLAVQVMGSGGPIADDHRGGAGNIVWIDGKARVVIDAGPGSFIRHGEAGVDFTDHEAILLTHLHGDHAGGLPGLLNSGSFAKRTEPLLLAGPDGSEYLPSTIAFVDALIGKQGAFPYLSAYLDDDPALPKLNVKNTQSNGEKMLAVLRKDGLDVDAIPVHHLAVPALAYVVRYQGRRLLFAGDQSFLSENFIAATLNGKPDIMIMHNAISMADGQPRGLHRDGLSIGEAAQSAKAQKLILSHHMQRALDDKDAILAAIRENYTGPIEFADDLSCYPVIP